MAGLLPETANLFSGAAQSSRTWKIDWENQRLGGFISGAEAMEQALTLALRTERFAHMIYGFGYGSELPGLVGRGMDYALAAAPALAEEAVLADSRVRSAKATNFSAEGNLLTGEIAVETAAGSLSLTVSEGGNGNGTAGI